MTSSGILSSFLRKVLQIIQWPDTVVISVIYNTTERLYSTIYINIILYITRYYIWCDADNVGYEQRDYGRKDLTRWRHQMETFSASLAICARNSPVTGEFPAQRPPTRSFGFFFGLRLNELLSKQSWGWWFEWHRAHYDVIVMTGELWFVFGAYLVEE